MMLKRRPIYAASIRKRDLLTLHEDGYKSEDSVDSDEMLQDMFARGELKPGLNAIAEVKEGSSDKKINRVKDLKRKLKDIELKLDWIERLDIVTDPTEPTKAPEAKNGDVSSKPVGLIVIEEEGDAQHDFKRETRIYRQAQAAVLQAIPKLHKLGVKTKRPDDYFAQMVKSDEHMKKVRQRLVEKQKGQEMSEKAKKMRELQKYGKQIQVEVLKKRQHEKKEMLGAVQRYKQGKGSSEELQKYIGDKKDKGKFKGDRKKGGKLAKREYKNTKYGYGGKKKGSKRNTADSSARFAKSYDKKVNSVPSKKKKNYGSKKRPGKTNRQKQKGRK